MGSPVKSESVDQSGANEPDALTCAVTDIGLTILALRDCDKAGEPVPSRLRARIRVMEDEWFNVPTAEGAERRRLLS